MEGGIWPTQKFWRGAPYARPLTGRGREREGGGEERKGRRGAESKKRGRKNSWNRAADWLRPALLLNLSVNKFSRISQYLANIMNKCIMRECLLGSQCRRTYASRGRLPHVGASSHSPAAS